MSRPKMPPKYKAYTTVYICYRLFVNSLHSEFNDNYMSLKTNNYKNTVFKTKIFKFLSKIGTIENCTRLNLCHGANSTLCLLLVSGFVLLA